MVHLVSMLFGTSILTSFNVIAKMFLIQFTLLHIFTDDFIKQGRNKERDMPGRERNVQSRTCVHESYNTEHVVICVSQK